MGEHRVLFERDPELRRTTWLIFNDWGRIVGAHTEQEVDDIIEANAEVEKSTHGRRFGEWSHAARVPLTLMEKTGLGDAIASGDRKYMSKILNDSDNSKLRTSRGKV